MIFLAMSKVRKIIQCVTPLILELIITFIILNGILYSNIHIVPNTFYHYIANRIYYKQKSRQEPLHSYCVSEITINKPIIGHINGSYYIFSEDILDDYTGNDTIFTNRKDVFEYSWNRPSGYFKNYKLFRKSFNIIYDGSQYAAIELTCEMYHMKVYEFRVRPKSFLLLIKNREFASQESSEDDILIAFTKEFYPTVIGTYSRKDLYKLRGISDSLRTIININDYPTWRWLDH